MGDCLVYASALLARASELLTGDAYLARVARGIQNPGGAEPELKAQFQTASGMIRADLAAFLMVPENEVIIAKAMERKDVETEAKAQGVT